MALDRGKKEVKLKTIDNHVPYVPAKSSFGIVYEAFEPTIKRLKNEAENVAAANYWQTFQTESSDQLYKFSVEFKNDPDGMKTAVDTYVNNLLEKVPPAYKLQATSMLMASRTHLVTNASNNRYNLDEAKFNFDNAKIWKNNNTNAENSIKVASEMPDFELSKGFINQNTADSILVINEQAHTDYELLVQKGSKETRSDSVHEKLINDNLIALHVSNGFHMMKTISENESELKALEWLKLLSENKNPTPIINKALEGNPAFIKFNNLLKDDDTRNDIIDKILSRYNDFKNERFTTNKSDGNINIEMHKEPNGILSWENFQGTEKSGHQVATDLGANVGSTKYNDIVEKVNYNNYIQGIISKYKHTNKLPDFKNEQEKKDVASAVLANFGIHDIQMGMDENGNFTDSFKTAAHVLSEMNIWPEEFTQYLKLDPAGDWSKPEVLRQFKEKILTYKYLTSNEVFPNWPGGDDFLKWASEQNLEYRNDVVAAEILNSYKDIDWEKRYNNIKTSFDDGREVNFMGMFIKDRMHESLRSTLFTPHAIVKLMMDEQNPYHKHLLSDTSTWMTTDPLKVMPPHAMMTFENMFINELTLMSNSNDFDVWAKVNAPLRKKAWHRTLQRLKDENWGVEVNTADGTPQLIQNPYHLVKGHFTNNDVYAALNKDFHLLNKDEQMAKYGTNNWGEVINNWFYEWADDGNKSRVKMELLNDGTNNYKMSFHKGGDTITLGQYFEPHAWGNVIDKDAPNSATEVVNHAADLMFTEFKKTDFFKSLDLKEAGIAEKFIYGMMRNGVKLSDWRFYPDIKNEFGPFGEGDVVITDELRPFYFLARMLGFDGDLREMRTNFQTMNAIANESKSFVKKINENRTITNMEKAVESMHPPHLLPHSKNNMELTFNTWVKENYQDQSLALTHKTNNWSAITSVGWDGEMDVNYYRDSRKFAVFAHPKNSIRASVKNIINHSTISTSANDIKKLYGDTPTIQEILEKLPYATNLTAYYESLDKHTDWEKTTKIDLMDNNQMHKLMKFIMKHEMGFEYYNKTFGTSNSYVDAVIFEGIQEAIFSYDGQLNKY